MGAGNCSPFSQLQKFLKFFGQNADDSGKSTWEKTLLKVVKARLVGCFLSRLPCQTELGPNDPGNLIWKSHISFKRVSWKSTRRILLPSTKQSQNQSKGRPRLLFLLWLWKERVWIAPQIAVFKFSWTSPDQEKFTVSSIKIWFYQAIKRGHKVCEEKSRFPQPSFFRASP